uniref:Uncharacterized protein n=1 Tax=Ditylenchus dipsaci TaxID=166011 RepID=A0A915EAH1_9BILA
MHCCISNCLPSKLGRRWCLNICRSKAETLIDADHRLDTTIPREMPEGGLEEVNGYINRLEEADEDLLPLYQQILKGYSDWGELRIKLKLELNIAH